MTSSQSDLGRLLTLDLPECVTDFLNRKGAAGPGGIRTVSLEGDASDRRYVRLLVGDPGEGDQGSYVLMQLSSPWVPTGTQTELPFVDIARHLSG